MPKKLFARCHVSLPQVERDALAAFASHHGDCSISLVISCLISRSGIVEWFLANDDSEPPANILVDKEIDLDDDVLRSVAFHAAKNGVSVSEMVNCIMGDVQRNGGFAKILEDKS